MVENLSCPNCGAPLANAGGAATVVCDHCGSVVAIQAPPAPDASHATEPRYEYGPAPAERPARSGLTSLALGPADASQVIQLLRNNQEQAAIQFYQAKVGVSLDEAIDAVRAIRDGLRDAGAPLAPSAAPYLSPADLPEVRQQLEAGSEIGAIKAYREATGKSLAEAKADVEAFRSQLYPGGVSVAPAVVSRPARSGSGSWGCAAVPLGIVAIFMCIFGGCSAFVQNQTAYRCSMREVGAAITKGQYLSPPISTSFLVLVTDMHSGTGSQGAYVGATLFAPVWGTNGFGLVYLVFNSAENLGYNIAGANLYMPGKVVNLLPFQYSRTFGYEPSYRYSCGP